MKTLFFSLAALLLFMLSACSAVQAGMGALPEAGKPSDLSLPVENNPEAATVEDRRITVNGSAQVMVVPDEVVLTLGIETWDVELAKARQSNDQIIEEVFAVMQDMGIDQKYIQTDYISIEPRYEDYYPRTKFVGYFVRKNVVVSLRDLTLFEELYARVLGAGVNYVHGVEFRTTELRKYRDQARALAIKAAQEKAVAMAGELDQEVGEPILIQENYDNWWSGYSSWWGSASGGMYQNVVQNAGQAQTEMEGTLAPGQISVTANVTVGFALK